MENKKTYTEGPVAVRIWLCTSVCLVLGIAIYGVCSDSYFSDAVVYIIPFFIASLIVSVPALIILWFCLISICKRFAFSRQKWLLLILSIFLITLLYGLLAIFIDNSFSSYNAVTASLRFGGSVTGILFLAALSATFINYKAICILFSADDFLLTELIQSNTTNMQQDNSSSQSHDQPQFQPSVPARHQTASNKILIKGSITAMLILLMLIPVSYIQGLITERKERQEQIISEVSSKWAASQTVTPPYLVIPFKTGDSSGSKAITQPLVILAETVSVKGDLKPEKRHRSNYDVLLYRSQLDMAGEFKFSLPKNISKEQLVLPEAKICAGISDSKGIEKQVVIHFNNTDVPLSPGLPVDVDSNGLSAPVDITPVQLDASIPFSLSLQLKGSSQLHFKPMSGNSSFELNSTWPHPSFDGNVIPGRDSNDETAEAGFPAKWSFSNANLPFTTVLQGDAIKNYNNLSFGVSLIQPVDEYVKCMRSIKYAILVIGLTFALFFIIEIIQKNPVHPVQYVLVGLALIIFYSLLVSISEFISFNWSYLIAATATVILITLYTKSHFKNWKTAGVFFGVLCGLYGVIYTLISLEDTALLTGSIVLFIVLAIAMYATRKINWYQPLSTNSDTQFSSSI